jgi:hypothetical protein
VCWIRNLLPKLVPDARIMTYGYDARTHGMSNKSSATLFDHAVDLLTQLKCARSDPKVSVMLSRMVSS